MASLSHRRATEDDLDFILTTERLPGYDDLVGRWEEAEHRVRLVEADTLYLIAERAGRPVGFAIVRRLDQTEAYMQRIAMAVPGSGDGSAFMTGLVADVFSRPHVDALALSVFERNARARRVYEKLGFRLTGRVREVTSASGRTHLSRRMRLVRPTV